MQFYALERKSTFDIFSVAVDAIKIGKSLSSLPIEYATELIDVSCWNKIFLEREV